MIKDRKILFAAAFFAVATFITSCKDDLPAQPVQKETSTYYGEWLGKDATTLTSSGVSTTVALQETMSLRNQDGRDTFNFKDPITTLPIMGRAGTWTVVEVGNSKIIRLVVKTSATRITYTTLTVLNKTDNEFKLLDSYGNNSKDIKTITYTK